MVRGTCRRSEINESPSVHLLWNDSRSERYSSYRVKSVTERAQLPSALGRPVLGIRMINQSTGMVGRGKDKPLGLASRETHEAVRISV